MLLQYHDTMNIVQGSPTRIELLPAFSWGLKIDDLFTDADLTLLAAHAIAPTNDLAVSWVSAGIYITSNHLEYQGT